MKRPIYLDHQATTPVDPRVLEAMLPYFTEHFGNAASKAHAFGWAAEGAVAEARERIARAIGAEEPSEIIFTSGATESNNLALRGAALAYARNGGGSRGHLIVTAIEHRAVLDPCAALEREGFEVSYVPVPKNGVLEPAQIEEAFRDNTLLVSVMAANNEIGTLQPIAETAALCRARNVLFHTDAAQALGQLPLAVHRDDIDLASLSAHKFYGPKGVGALYVRRVSRQVRLVPQLLGGGHELGLRSGTLNVPGIVGMGVAAELAVRELEAVNAQQLRLRELLWQRLVATIPAISLNGDSERRLSGNLNLLIPGVRADKLMLALPLLALASGSACSSLTGVPSHVLRALGLGEEAAACSIRIGMGRHTTEEEVLLSADRLEAAVARLRGRAQTP